MRFFGRLSRELAESALDEILTMDRLVYLVEDFILFESSKQDRANEMAGVVQTKSRATK